MRKLVPLVLTLTAALMAASRPAPAAAAGAPPPPSITFSSPCLPPAPCSQTVPVVPTTLAHLWVAATVSSQPNTPTVIDSNPPPVLTITPTHIGQAAAPANACTIDSNSTSASCQWGTASAPIEAQFPYNGTYTLTITATTCYVFGCGAGTGNASAQQQFALAMPPATPTVDPPKIDPTKSDVTLTWPANTEPDLVPAAAYGIQRDGQPIATVKQPGAGGAVSYTDAAVVPGSHTYQVITFRCGVKSDCSDVVPSRHATSDTVIADVPAATPSSGPTTTAVSGTSGAGTTATTTGASASPSPGPGASSNAVRDSVDLSGFAGLLAKARAASHFTVTTEPDPGFQRTLPFHQRATLPGSDGSPLGNAGPIGHLFDPRTVALGMFLIVLGMHGFVLRTVARRTVTADGIAEPVEVQ